MDNLAQLYTLGISPVCHHKLDIRSASALKQDVAGYHFSVAETQAFHSFGLLNSSVLQKQMKTQRDLSNTNQKKQRINKMSRFRNALALAALSATLSGGLIFAQDRDHDRDHHDRDNHKYAQHHEWRRGHQIRHEDWDRGERVENYRRYHLSAPRRGYEWRLIDGNYVLINTGNYQIRTIVVAH